MKTSCHCGSVRIEVERPDQVTYCNCSICSRYQAIWAYYEPEQVQIEGQDSTDSYSWGDKELAFIRCANCGCVTHYQTLPGQPDPLIAVNVRLVDDDSLQSIPVRQSDGKNS